MFPQIDGGETQKGPPDMDGIANGHVVFAQRVGIAPTSYILVFSHPGGSQQVSGTCLPLASPAHTVSGHVTPPSGVSARYILLSLDRNYQYQGEGVDEWQALTDSLGNYEIGMTSDTAGNPWTVRLGNPFPPNVVQPAETTFTITGDHAGIDFVFRTAVAQIAGRLTDEWGNPLPFRSLHIAQGPEYQLRQTTTDIDGFFQFGILPEEVDSTDWRIQTDINGEFTTNELWSQRYISSITTGDSLYRPMVVYTVNSQIQGTILVDGVPPTYPVTIIAWNQDTAQAAAQSTPGTGTFSIPVTDKIAQYQLFPISLMFAHDAGQVYAAPGETGVTLAVTTLGVGDDPNAVPLVFALHQNYPNPFNPSTTIRYALPTESRVTLTVFNLLGQKVATLIDGIQSAGERSVRWTGTASGLYFYQLNATSTTDSHRSFSDTRTMILMK
jgi:hypothetical protein